MSKTFKTRPTWVKALEKASPAISERHDHSSGPCDINEIESKRVFYWQRWGSCGYYVNYYGWNNGFYAREPRAKDYCRIAEGRMRAQWRKTKHDLLKLDTEDIKDYDVVSSQHRHSALWEVW